MRAIWILTRLTFREAVRRRIVLAAILLGVGFLLVFSLGFHMITGQPIQISGTDSNPIVQTESYNFLLLAGLYAITFLLIALGALLAADTLAGEISSGTVQTVVTKPLDRFQVVLGKWFGFAGLLGLYLVLMAGGAIVSVWLQSRYLAPHLLVGLGLIYLESLLIMSVSLLCSSRLSALATGAVVFGLYGLAFIGGWIEQIGSFLQNSTAVYIGIVTSLVIPSETLWRRAAFEMQSPLAGLLGMSPFGTISVPSPASIIYAILYILLALALTLRTFSRRDL
jgi:Cu-processing system permease protein